MKNADRHERNGSRWKIIGMMSSVPATAPTASDKVK